MIYVGNLIGARTGNFDGAFVLITIRPAVHSDIRAMQANRCRLYMCFCKILCVYVTEHTEVGVYVLCTAYCVYCMRKGIDITQLSVNFRLVREPSENKKKNNRMPLQIE